MYSNIGFIHTIMHFFDTWLLCFKHLFWDKYQLKLSGLVFVQKSVSMCNSSRSRVSLFINFFNWIQCTHSQNNFKHHTWCNNKICPENFWEREREFIQYSLKILGIQMFLMKWKVWARNNIVNIKMLSFSSFFFF